MSRWRTRVEDQDGAIAVMAAVLVVAMLLAGALSVDVGRVAYSSRDQQGATDRAALDGVRLVGELRPDEVTDLEGLLTVVHDGAIKALERNPRSGTSRERLLYRVDLGYADGDAATDFRHVCTGYFEHDEPSSRPVLEGKGIIRVDDPADEGEPDDSCDETLLDQVRVDAVQVWTYGAVDYVLAITGSGTELHKAASARDPYSPPPPDCPPSDPACPPPPTTQVGHLSIGTTLLTLNSDDSRVLSRVVGSLLGGSVDISAVGFEGLANAYLELSWLGDFGVDLGSVDEILNSTVRINDLLDASIAGLTTEDSALHAEAITALHQMRAMVDSDLEFGIGDLFNITTNNPEAFVDGRFNVLDLIMGSLMAVDGERLAGFQATGSGLFGLPGLRGIDVGLEILQGPQFAIGPANYIEGEGWETWAETAQIDLTMSTTLSRSEVENLLGGTISGLLGNILCIISFLCPSEQTLTTTLTTASGRADLTAVECLEPLEDSKLTTLVSTDTLTATISRGSNSEILDITPGSDDQTQVLLDGIPSEASVSDSLATDSPLLNRTLHRTLALLGADTGHAEVRAHHVHCGNRGLMPYEE